ncbi:MAG: NUDIX hydrolase [archaeon]|jgi:8-oxo-dGTP pyrophosphatase MutT (NUDIX family)
MNYRQGASAFIINDKKEFLMVLGVKKDRSEPDYWKIPAGGVEGNEDFETALKREMLEEIGITELDYDIIGKSKYTDKFTWPKEVSQKKFEKKGVWYDGQERVIFVLKLKNPNQEFKLQVEEVAGIKWFNKNNFESIILFPIQIEFMKKVIEEFKEYF